MRVQGGCPALDFRRSCLGDAACNRAVGLGAAHSEFWRKCRRTLPDPAPTARPQPCAKGSQICRLFCPRPDIGPGLGLRGLSQWAFDTRVLAISSQPGASDPPFIRITTCSEEVARLHLSSIACVSLRLLYEGPAKR